MTCVILKITYDPRYNIAYIKLREKTKRGVETLHISDEVNIDISPNGEIYGIELLDANNQLKVRKDHSFTFEDASVGKEVRVPIPA